MEHKQEPGGLTEGQGVGIVVAIVFLTLGSGLSENRNAGFALSHNLT